MIQQYFGLKHIPLAKNGPFIHANETFSLLKERFSRLLTHPGIGILTGEVGVGKTACLRHLCSDLNPHQYEVFYLAETLFTNYDIYLRIAQNFNLKPSHRFAQLWRDIKNHIQERVENKHNLPILIIDEAHNLPYNFFQGLPSFLNYDFDSKDMITMWLVGHPELNNKVNQHPALSSRVRARHTLNAINEPAPFANLINSAFKEAGSITTMLSDSGIELLRTSSNGKPRLVNKILDEALSIASSKGLNHIPDDIIEAAIVLLKA